MTDLFVPLPRVYLGILQPLEYILALDIGSESVSWLERTGQELRKYIYFLKAGAKAKLQSPYNRQPLPKNLQ